MDLEMIDGVEPVAPTFQRAAEQRDGGGGIFCQVECTAAGIVAGDVVFDVKGRPGAGEDIGKRVGIFQETEQGLRGRQELVIAPEIEDIEEGRQDAARLHGLTGAAMWIGVSGTGFDDAIGEPLSDLEGAGKEVVVTFPGECESVFVAFHFGQWAERS